MKKILFLLIVFFSFNFICNADELAPNAKSAILMNYDTGTIVFEKNSNEKMAPASMTKMMTLLIVMENIDNGKLKYDDEVVISNNAANMGGSQIFLQANQTMKVEDLIKGTAIASGNDSAVALAERIGGSTDNFVKMMNDKCNEIGCTNSNFVNVHGLDEDNHYSSAHDMALIAKELIKHSDILKFTSTYEEYLTKSDGTKTWLVNTNKLVRFMSGVDGLKTGFTSNALYCLTATGKRDNIRFISVVMGEDTTSNRSDDTVNMLNYGFNNYKLNKVITKENDLGKINIKMGKIKSVDLTVIDELTILKSINEEDVNYEYNINLNSVTAPIKYGDVVGYLEVIENGEVKYTIDLTVKEDVERCNLLDIFKNNLKHILLGY